jgi:hypothetical protein
VAGKRDRQAFQQTSSNLRGKRGGIPRPAQAFEQQMAPVIASLKADGELTEPVKQMLMSTDLDQVHHIDGLDVLDALFQNISKEQSDELNAISPVGNDIRNSMVIPLRAHQGKSDEYSVNKAVHQRLRELGLEQGAKAEKLHPLLQEINNSAEAPFETKKSLFKRYVNEIQPLMVEAIDESLTEYETRFAGEVIDKLLKSAR